MANTKASETTLLLIIGAPGLEHGLDYAWG